MTTDEHPREKSGLLEVAALALGYAAAGRVGQLLAIPPGNVTSVWPASGLALGAVLLRGPQIWPGIWVGAFLVNTTVLSANRSLFAAVVVGACISVGATLEALTGAALSRRFGGERGPFAEVRGVAVFVLLSCMLSCIISATAGVSSLYVGGYIERSALPVTWWTWWQGDAAGALVVAPLLSIWARGPSLVASMRRALARPLFLGESLMILALLLGVSLASWGAGYPVVFLTFPLMVWAAFRFGPRGASGLLFAASAFSVCFALWGLARGTGSFAGRERSQALLLLHAFIDTAAVTTLTLLATIAERRQAEAQLAEYSHRLEARVSERTAALSEANAQLTREVAERRRAEAQLAEHSHKLEASVSERTMALSEVNAQLTREVAERKGTEEAFRQMNELLEATIEERTTELRDKLSLIEQQQETLLLLSTPVIRIWDGVLVLPLIGAIDARRASQIMESSLAAIARHRARIFIIDITGTPFADAEVAEYLARTARAAGLLGVQCMLVGISPKLAEALVMSGADLGGVATFGGLQSGLQEALRRMRYRIART